jgi:hypothetical protein
MNDTPLNPPHRRSAASAEAAPKKALYVVKGADIWTSEGRKRDGSTVELTAAEARHFVNIGRLAPYIPGEEHEG